VKNIPKHWTDKDLYDVFKERGVVSGIKIYTNEQYGFVNFDSRDSLDYWIAKGVKV
jgi:RNA recognition motif-containing protein